MKVCFVFNVLVLVFDEDVGWYGGEGAARGDDVIADVIGWLRVKVFMHVLQKEMDCTAIVLYCWRYQDSTHKS
jgi:hypothetical protein